MESERQEREGERRSLLKLPLVERSAAPEVDEDVNDEHDVHDEVDHVEWRAGVNAALHGRIFLERQKRLKR